jgi:regulator of extracellular matrix RemA (YlzA/DUF370 family)
MFLHVGTDVVVSLKRVIAILDLKSAGSSEATQAFLDHLKSQKKVTDISGGDAKSLVLTDTEAFLSPISSLTLKKRCDFLGNNPNLDFVL